MEWDVKRGKMEIFIRGCLKMMELMERENFLISMGMYLKVFLQKGRLMDKASLQAMIKVYMLVNIKIVSPMVRANTHT